MNLAIYRHNLITYSEDHLADQALDWLFSNEHAPALEAFVLRDSDRYSHPVGGPNLSASDHMPVTATFAV